MTVRDGGADLSGKVAGVDDDGALRLVDAAGTVHRIVAGEVTIPDGYGI